MQMTAEAPMGNPFYGQAPQMAAPQMGTPVPQPQFTNINDASTVTPPVAPTQESGKENVEVAKQFNV